MKGRLATAGFVARLTTALATGRVPNDMHVPKQTVERQVRALHLWGKDNTIYEKLTTIQIPTLVTGGFEDALDLPENVRAVALQIPYAWSAYFPEAGHGFVSQDYVDFSQLVHIFIGAQ